MAPEIDKNSPYEIEAHRHGPPVDAFDNIADVILPNWNDAEELEAFLEAQRQDLAILINELKVSRPPIYLDGLMLVVVTLLLLGALAVAGAPYLGLKNSLTISHSIATVSAFLGVFFAFAAYVTLRRYTADREIDRLSRRVIGKAYYLQQVVEEISREVQRIPALISGEP
jgi:hypothetical protein